MRSVGKRRPWLGLGAAVASAALVLSGCGGSSDSDDSTPDSITFINAGGDPEAALIAGFIEPFTEATGIEVKLESPQGLGRLQALIESGDVYASLTELSAADLEQAVAQGLVEKLDWEAIDPDPMIEGTQHDYGLPHEFFTTLMAWGPDVTPIETWEQFWDVENYPGVRGMPEYPSYVLPFALLADGVDPEELFPLDVDRAFTSLDRIKEHVVFWQAGAQPIQMLRDGELDYSIAWSGRVAVAPELGFTFNQGLMESGNLAIPKGAPHVEAAYEFLRQVTIAENQAKRAEIVPYAGPSPDLMDLLDESVTQYLTTTPENAEVQIQQDAQWWAENGAEVAERWADWMS